MKIKIIKCLQDNYSYILIDEKSNDACVIDPSESKPIINYIEKNNIKLKFILNTHHHFDHVGGNKDLKKKYNSKVIGFEKDKDRIPEIDIFLYNGEIWKNENFEAKIYHIPGHTMGHICYHFFNQNILFTGDTLFSLGCGRIFEGTYEEMFKSLNKLKNLPIDTKIYCGHEYTKKNLEFCLEYDSKNEFLKKKIDWISSRIKSKSPTIPISIDEEKKTNIFLRCNELSIKNALNLNNASEQEIFSKLRDLKDSF